MYQIPELKKFPGLAHAFSTKSEGNMSFRWGQKEAVLRNRERFLSQLGITLDSCVALKIQDKNVFFAVDHHFVGRGMKKYEDAIAADGLITKEKNLHLFLLIADCLPIILFDLRKGILSLIHSGWKSTEAKTAFKIVKRLITEFNCKPSDIHVAVGPAIHKQSFRFTNPIQKQLPDWKPFLEDLPNGDTAIDLIGYNKKQLENAGVPPRNIFVSNIDTAKNLDFFSRYRDSRQFPKNEGRFACIAGLK